jgi:UDP-3-O-[3-hydroxymyristoyl] glucosamine N-acyltransferase
VPIFNLPAIPFVRSYRGAWFSVESIPWYYHNALTYLVRYTILDLITPSPLNLLFYKMMGMKIGKGVLINTTNISDPCLIILEDNVTIGGSVYMMAHYGMKGFLIIDKLHIKRGAMVGLAAKLLGGVTIGEKAVVAPNVVVYPKTTIKPGEKYGVPLGS